MELAVSSPVAAWHWVQKSFATRDSLEAENQRLRTRLRDLALRSMRYDALAQQNTALIGLRESLPPVAQRWLPPTSSTSSSTACASACSSTAAR